MVNILAYVYNCVIVTTWVYMCVNGQEPCILKEKKHKKEKIKLLCLHCGSTRSAYYAAHAVEIPAGECLLKSIEFFWIYLQCLYGPNKSALNKDVSR